jgi:hypothetical protein
MVNILSTENKTYWWRKGNCRLHRKTKERNRRSEAFETHLFSEDDRRLFVFSCRNCVFFSSREGIIAEFRAAAQADPEIAAWGKKVTVTFGSAFFQQILRYTPTHLLPDLSTGMRMWMSGVLGQLLSPFQPTYCKQSPKKSAMIIRKSVFRKNWWFTMQANKMLHSARSVELVYV